MENVRVKSCGWCKFKFWSGKEGVISPLNHQWFCSKEHYISWWKDYDKKTKSEVAK